MRRLCHTPGRKRVTKFEIHEPCKDLGVRARFGRKWIPMLRVKARPAAGQYVFNEKTGVYIFSKIDSAVQREISFLVPEDK
jgi:hypothetical protein